MKNWFNVILATHIIGSLAALPSDLLYSQNSKIDVLTIIVQIGFRCYG